MNQPPMRPPTAPQQTVPGPFQPHMAPGGTAAAPRGPAGGSYEFTEEENKTVERAAAWAKGLGFIMFLECGLQLINLNVLGLILHAVLGVLFWRGGTALTNVVETEGNDVQHLLEALEKLGMALMIRIVVVSVVALLLFALGIVLLLMAM